MAGMRGSSATRTPENPCLDQYFIGGVSPRSAYALFAPRAARIAGIGVIEGNGKRRARRYDRTRSVTPTLAKAVSDDTAGRDCELKDRVPLVVASVLQSCIEAQELDDFSLAVGHHSAASS